jgi:hypothetical protein
MLRMVIHNWPDADAIKIMRLLRSSANSVSKLIIFDNIITYTCHIAGRGQETNHSHLLANLGIVGAGASTRFDMQVGWTHGQSIVLTVYCADVTYLGWKRAN